PPSANPNPLGLVAGDPAGFPNGRRLLDDVVTVELRAIAGLTIPLVDPSFSPDGAASLIQDGTALPPASNNLPAFLNAFPYVPLRSAARWRLPDDSGNDVAMTVARTRSHPENPHAGQGPVVLDIGLDVGALVVGMPESMADMEIEIRPVGPSDRALAARLHVA